MVAPFSAKHSIRGDQLVKIAAIDLDRGLSYRPGWNLLAKTSSGRSFPSNEALLKLFCLALRNISQEVDHADLELEGNWAPAVFAQKLFSKLSVCI